uniref:Transmembrane domain-containing protein n=1 Tax=Spironucleus salmonicida TaxID=348837 RepID=V6LMP7_9EUKA|eukprot:EST45900.1 Transmembrane domain-containing protein [Spironucleus salmonicida]
MEFSSIYALGVVLVRIFSIYYCIYRIYYYTYQYIFTYQPRYKVHQEGYSHQQCKHRLCRRLLVFYVQYLPATEVGTTSTGTPSSSIDSTKAGMSGTGVVIDDNTILQYIQQQLKWSLVVYMHWEWCLQGYLVYTIVFIEYTTILTNTYSLINLGTRYTRKGILTSNASTGYAEYWLYSIFNTRMMHNLSKMVFCSLTRYAAQDRSIGMDEFQMVTTTRQDEFY